MKKVLILLLIALVFLGCEPKEAQRPMVVSTNLWIGYSPLYYAEKKGWLRESNIKLVRSVSLGESLGLYNDEVVDMVCGTQYEILQIADTQKEQGSVILLDRSNGGDFVLSNRTVAELKSEKKIDVYLEIESVNSLLLKEFINKHSLDSSRMNMIDSPQILNSKLHMRRDATIVVTYDPYNIKLEKEGYKEVGSTKDSELLVLDAIYISFLTENKFSKELDALNRVVYKSLEALKSNPKEYFEVINPYYQYDSYKQFEESLKLIEWIYADHKVIVNRRKEIKNMVLPKLIKPYEDKK